MGTNIAVPEVVLGDGEEVLRGLNPTHCDGGLPTEGCFILKPHDEEGPSFGILAAPAEAEQVAPVGARQGISPELFATLLPRPANSEFGVAQLNVGRAVQQVRAAGVRFLQVDDTSWGENRAAHAMLWGYQTLEPKIRKELQRFLARLAAEKVLKKASISAS